MLIDLGLSTGIGIAALAGILTPSSGFVTNLGVFVQAALGPRGGGVPFSINRSHLSAIGTD